MVMIRKLAFAIAFVVSAVPAHAQTGSVKTPANLNAEINALWPDQNVGGITPFNARQTLLDMVASGSSITNTTSQYSVSDYGFGVTTGKAGFQITNTDDGALTALAKYSAWISAANQGTGDGTPAATTYALGLSAIKSNWPTSTVKGEYGGLNIAVRGGYTGDSSITGNGDTSAILTNVAISNTWNAAFSHEGVTNYFPAGSGASASILSVNTQMGTLLPSVVDSSNGFYTQAQNGQLGTAFYASNLGTNGTAKYGTASNWTAFLKYIYDDGTHAPYPAFLVDKVGNLYAHNMSTFAINLAGVNFNSANTDTTIPIVLPANAVSYRVQSILIGNASESISTATFGLFTATGGGGITVIPSTAITVTTAAANTVNNMQLAVAPTANTQSYIFANLFFRVGTGQGGSTARADVILTLSPIY